MNARATADVVVVGAGPAGTAAATSAASLGLSVRVLDEQPTPGGQIHRGVTRADEAVASRLGENYRRGRARVDAMRASGAILEAGATVVDVGDALDVAYLRDEALHEIVPRHLIVATGAIERAVPFAGGTLPGVMTAGAAQAMLKGAASVPSGRIALAGCGPLLVLVAAELVRAGAEVVAMLETTSAADFLRAMPCLPRALAAIEVLAEGRDLLRTLRDAGVERLTGIDSIAALGERRVAAVRVTRRGRAREIAVDTLLVHAGIVPNIQVTRLLRLEHDWDERQLAWRPRVDAWGRSSDPRVGVAGDGAGIGGALAAEASGALAGLDAACALGAIGADERERRAAPLVSGRRRCLAVRPWLDELFRPPVWIVDPPDEAIVCRCEEVPAAAIRAAVRAGCRGPNQTKFLSRCGMGPCQGRVCGSVVTTILARATGLAPRDVGYTRIRPPLVPVPLAALAALHEVDRNAGGSDGHGPV